VKAACGPIAEPAPEIAVKPVRPSAQLAALLGRNR
jgi:chromatin remodeling complex protein RSC6